MFDPKAIRKEYLRHLADSDQEDEESAIDTSEDKRHHMKISAEECEQAARPKTAGDYRRPWDAFRATCKLFKDELDALDKASRDQTDKSTFGKRTKTAHEWFEGLSKEKKREAELAADKWNQEGAPKHQQVVSVSHRPFIFYFHTSIFLVIGKKISNACRLNFYHCLNVQWESMQSC